MNPKILIAYSSRTGNTEKVAKAIYEVLSARSDIQKLPEVNCEKYDTVVMGYWVDKGTANEESLNFIKSLSGKKVVLFGTLGAGDYNGYYQKVREAVEKELPADCTLLGHKLFRATSIMLHRLRKQHAENPDDLEIKKRLEDYEKNKHRPDENDLKEAQEFVLSILGK
ncbi:MAG: flavodoxin [Firmicutes bacterium]|nr:flavodoxin [Bacillota bacterium]